VTGLDNSVWLTDADSFTGCDWKDERNDGNDGKEKTRNDEVDDVVERLAMKLYYERSTRERRHTAVVGK